MYKVAMYIIICITICSFASANIIENIAAEKITVVNTAPPKWNIMSDITGALETYIVDETDRYTQFEFKVKDLQQLRSNYDITDFEGNILDNITATKVKGRWQVTLDGSLGDYIKINPALGYYADEAVSFEAKPGTFVRAYVTKDTNRNGSYDVQIPNITVGYDNNKWWYKFNDTSETEESWERYKLTIYSELPVDQNNVRFYSGHGYYDIGLDVCEFNKIANKSPGCVITKRNESENNIFEVEFNSTSFIDPTYEYVFTNNDSYHINGSIWENVHFTKSLNNSLRLYYSFDVETDKVVDLSNYSNHGTITSTITLTEGILGNAYDFDGSTGHIDTENDVFVESDFADGITLAVWTNATSPSDDEQIVSIEGAYYLGIDEITERYEFEIDGNGFPLSRATTTADGNWYFIVGTANSSGFTRIYIDGVQEDTGQETYFAIDTLNRPTTIGGHPVIANTHVDGGIDEVMIFDKELTATEINDLYNFTRKKFYDKSETQIFNITPTESNNAANVTINSLTLNDSSIEFGMYYKNTTDDPDLTKLGEHVVFYAPYDTDDDDKSAFGNSPTVTGSPTIKGGNGNFDNASWFDGISDYYRYDSLSTKVNDGPFSMSVWVKNNLTSSTSRLVYTQDNLDFYLSWNANEKYQFSARATGGGMACASNTVFNDNSDWHFIVGTWDADDGLELYVDGVLECTYAGEGGTAAWADQDLYVGGNSIYNDYKGYVDELTFFNKTLTQEERNLLYYTSLQKYQKSSSVAITDNQSTTAFISQDSTQAYPYFILNSNNGLMTPYLFDNYTLNLFNSTPGDAEDTTPPSSSNAQEYPAEPATYATDQWYEFNITMTDDTAVDTVKLVMFDLGQNYTASQNGDVYNATIIDRFATGLAYQYYWWANDTSGNINITPSDTYGLMYEYSVSQATGDVELYVNNTYKNLTVVQGTTLRLNATLISGESNVTLEVNGTILNNSRGPIHYDYEFTNLGDYNISTTMETGNFTQDSEWLIVTVEAPPPELQPPTISNVNFYALNSSGDIMGDYTYFNTDNLTPIEQMLLNFTVQDDSNLTDNLTLWFTANGSSGCSMGNLQSNTCYNYSDNNWVQFTNGTVTSSFKDEGATGDFISCSYSGNESLRTYSCIIHEHYNPNVFKWYSADFNFSDVKWQDGINQRIGKNKMIKIEINDSLIPGNADQYKLDLRVNYSTQTPTQPLELCVCSSSYVSGDPRSSPECVVVSSLLPSEFQDDGTKYRAIVTRGLFDSLGDVRYIMLLSDVINPQEHYILKTYKADTVGWTTHWEFTTNTGTTWSNLGDGYESELNVNWFYDGAEPSQILFKIEQEDNLQNKGNSSIYGMTWDIDPNQNYAPIISFINPEIGENISEHYTISWLANEPNNDNMTFNLTLSQGSTTSPIVENLDNSTFNYLWDSAQHPLGTYNLTLYGCENDTVDLLCSSLTHEIILVDIRSPNTTQTNPPNNHNISDTPYTIQLNGTVFDDRVISNVSLLIDGVINQTNTSGLINGSYNFEVEFSQTNSTYQWALQSCDVSGNCNTTGNRTLHTWYFVLTDSNPPYYQNLIENPPSPFVYVPNQTYHFNASWFDDNSVDEVFFEWEGVNYTPSQNGDVYNYSINDLAVGSYTYRWYANDSFGKFNDTGELTYNVTQATGSVNLLLNGVDANININVNNTVNMTGFLVNGLGNIQLYQNGSIINDGISPITNVTNFTTAGTYVINLTYSGTSNYTSSFESHIINVVTPTAPTNASATVEVASDGLRPFIQLLSTSTGIRPYVQIGTAKRFE